MNQQIAANPIYAADWVIDIIDKISNGNFRIDSWHEWVTEGLLHKTRYTNQPKQSKLLFECSYLRVIHPAA